MANIHIEPTFVDEATRLLFLTRLWSTVMPGLILTTANRDEWAAYFAAMPVRGAEESYRDFQDRREAWREGRVAVRERVVHSKWGSYRLGKVKPAAEEYLRTRPSPNRVQAREAVRLQLEAKYVSHLAGLNVTLDLLSLIDGLVW